MCICTYMFVFVYVCMYKIHIHANRIIIIKLHIQVLILVISAHGTIGDNFLIYTNVYFHFPRNEQNPLSRLGKEILKNPHICKYQNHVTKMNAVTEMRKCPKGLGYGYSLTGSPRGEICHLRSM